MAKNNRNKDYHSFVKLLILKLVQQKNIWKENIIFIYKYYESLTGNFAYDVVCRNFAYFILGWYRQLSYWDSSSDSLLKYKSQLYHLYGDTIWKMHEIWYDIDKIWYRFYLLDVLEIISNSNSLNINNVVIGVDLSVFISLILLY